jgi:hypothetical protein
MTFVLLTGATFSHNWGGWLASESFEYLLGCPDLNADLRLDQNHSPCAMAPEVPAYLRPLPEHPSRSLKETADEGRANMIPLPIGGQGYGDQSPDGTSCQTEELTAEGSTGHRRDTHLINSG